MKSLGRGLLAAAAISLCAAPTIAADEQLPLAKRTADSGAGLTPAQERMDLPLLALGISVDPATKTIAGLANYTVRAVAPLSQVDFDFDPRFALGEVTVNGESLARDRWSNTDGVLRIRLPAEVRVGQAVTVGIAYSGAPFVAPRPPWLGGIDWQQTSDGKPWVATTIQGEGCDLLWPCIDHPSVRVGLLDFAVTVPAGLIAAANGKLVGHSTENGLTTWHWQARKPNSYGVSLQIGPYELAQGNYASRYGNAIPIRFWHLPENRGGAERLVAEMDDYLDFFESTIGPYPFGDEKVGLVETHHLGMEHQTINAYGKGYVFEPQGYDELMHHEFAHEWFANQLSNAGNEDMWLQEGLGTYMQPLYLGWKGGEMAFHANMWELRKKIASRVPLAPREKLDSGFYNDTEAGWGGDIYYKGAWAAHTLRYLIGDTAFFATLRNVVYGRDDPQPGNFDVQVASTDDFMAVAEAKSGMDLDWFTEAYFRVAALPELEIRREGRALHLAWKTPATQPFAMPLELEIDGEPRTVPMTGGSGAIELPSPRSHVLLDPQSRILRHDPAIAAWQKQDADRQAAAARQ